MRHKLLFLLAILAIFAACNSITGTQPTNAPTANVPQKVCLDDLRAVNILQPFTESDVYAGTRQLVVWEVVEFCGPWDAELSVSYDNMRTWQSCGCTRKGCAKCWVVPDGVANSVAWVKVSVRDPFGEVQDIHSFPIRGRTPRPPEQRD